MRETLRQPQGRAADDQQHAQCHEEGRYTELGDEETAGEADENGDPDGDDEGDLKREHAFVEEEPHQHGREAEHRPTKKMNSPRLMRVIGQAVMPARREGQQVPNVQHGGERAVDGVKVMITPMSKRTPGLG